MDAPGPWRGLEAMGAGLGVSSCLTDFAGDWWGVRGSGKILLDTPGRTGDGFGKVGGGIGGIGVHCLRWYGIGTYTFICKPGVDGVEE